MTECTKVILAIKTNYVHNLLLNDISMYFQMSCIMCSCFMLAWTPYAVVSFMFICHAAQNIPMPLIVAAPYFAKSSTCYNPIVYFLSIAQFRLDAKEVICRRWKRTDSDENHSFNNTCRTKTECHSSNNLLSLNRSGMELTPLLFRKFKSHETIPASKEAVLRADSIDSADSHQNNHKDCCNNINKETLHLDQSCTS